MHFLSSGDFYPILATDLLDWIPSLHVFTRLGWERVYPFETIFQLFQIQFFLLSFGWFLANQSFFKDLSLVFENRLWLEVHQPLLVSLLLLSRQINFGFLHREHLVLRKCFLLMRIAQRFLDFWRNWSLSRTFLLLTAWFFSVQLLLKHASHPLVFPLLHLLLPDLFLSQFDFLHLLLVFGFYQRFYFLPKFKFEEIHLRMDRQGLIFN